MDRASASAPLWKIKYPSFSLGVYRLVSPVVKQIFFPQPRTYVSPSSLMLGAASQQGYDVRQNRLDDGEALPHGLR